MSISAATLLNHLYPLLHATSAADLQFWTDDDLKTFLTNRLQDTVKQYGLLVEIDSTSITLVAGTQAYPAPPDHLDTMHVALSGKPLIASSTYELERLDNSYQTTPSTAAKPVKRFFEDKQGFNIIGLHPVPAAAEAGLHPEVIYHSFPCDSESIELPKVIGDYLELLTLGEAYSRESDLSILETAQSAKALASLFEDRMQQLYGQAQ